MTPALKGSRVLLLGLGAAFLGLVGAACKHRPFEAIYLFLLTALQLVPFCLWRGTRQFTYVAILFTGQFFFFSWRGYSYALTKERAFQFIPYSEKALLFLSLATGITLSVYFLVRRSIRSGSIVPPDFHPIVLKPWQVAAAAGLVCLELLVRPRLGPFTVPYLHLQFVVTALLHVASCPRQPILLSFAIGAVVGAAILHFLTTGIMTPAYGLGFLWFALLFLRPSGLAWTRLILLGLVFGVGQLIKMDYRTYAHFAPATTLLERVELALNLAAGQLLRWNRAETLYVAVRPASPQDSVLPVSERARRRLVTSETSFQVSLPLRLLTAWQRYGDDSLRRVLSGTPDPVPYWGGRSYEGLALLVVPRFLWPQKPSWNIWNEYGFRYGYLPREDKKTSVSFNYLAEGYMNFGMIGLCAAAIAFGLLVAVLERVSELAPSRWRLLWLLCFLRPVFYPFDAFTIASLVLAMGVIVLLPWVSAILLKRMLAQLPLGRRPKLLLSENATLGSWRALGGADQYHAVPRTGDRSFQ